MSGPRVFKPLQDAAPRGGSGRRRWVYPLACPLLLLSPFVAFIKAHGYGYATLEVLLILGGLTASGLVFALVLLLARNAARTAGLLVLIFLFIDIQAGWNSASDQPHVLLWSLVLLPAWLLRAHLGEIAAAVSGTILLTTLVLPLGQASLGSAKARAEPRAGVPPVIHIVLDEHAGLEALHPRASGDAELRRLLRAFYAGYGFRLYGRAYSRHAETVASLAHTVNFADPDAAPRSDLVVRVGSGFSLNRNDYFERLRKAGYRLRVSQTSYLDLCGALSDEQAECRTTRVDDLRAIRKTRLSAARKARAIAKLYLERSAVYDGVRSVYGVFQIVARHSGLMVPIWPLEPFRVSSVSAVTVLEDLAAAVAQASEGDFFFAHVLLPHYPYALTPDCRVAPPEAWLTRVSLFLPGRLGLTSPKSFSDVVHRRYYEQAACLYRLLDKVMRAAERSPLARRFVVIVHGDHGSKIHAPLPLTDALDDLSRHDLVQNYATLFAVRAPAIAPGYDSEQRAVQELVATLVENDFLSLASAGESSGEAFVYVSATADPLSYGARKVPISDFEAADPPARP